MVWSSMTAAAAGGAGSDTFHACSAGSSGATYGWRLCFGCCPERTLETSAITSAIDSDRTRRTTICDAIIASPTQSLGCVASNDPRARLRLAVHAAHRASAPRVVGLLRDCSFQHIP